MQLLLSMAFARLRNTFGRFDWVLLLAVGGLLALGIATIWSVALSRDPGNLSTVVRQGTAAGLGLLLMFILAATNYRLFRSYSTLLYIGALLLLAAVLIVGTTIRGTTGWLHFAGWSFQPVEFVKFALVVFLARYLADHPRGSFGTREFFVLSAFVGAPIVLVLLQPDLGSALVLIAIWVGLLALARIRKRYVILLVLSGVVLAGTAWFFLAPYQQDRILTFLNPSRDPLGRGYNVTQAMIAVGAGGFRGRGLGFGSQTQLRFLPESQTDFILAVIAEDFGFVGILIVLAALSLIGWRLFAIARTAPDDFTLFLILGILLAFVVPCIINIGMNLGLMPVTGIALPLLSYGGSSLLMVLVMFGVVESIAVRRPLTVLTRF